MKERNFRQMLEKQWEKGNFVCVGLDSEYEELPSAMMFPAKEIAIYLFNRAIIDMTKDLVCAYKPNLAFYEANNKVGYNALCRTITHIQRVAPDVPVILDAKRGDIGNTNRGYVKMAFDDLRADAITVHPYLGQEALKPFLERKDKGIIVLCRTSNPGAGEFQDLHTLAIDPRAKPDDMTAEEWLKILCKDSMRLYESVALNVMNTWNKNDNCLIVVGATYPEELEAVRQIVGDMPILIPAVGAQGGDVEKAVKAGKDSRGKGMIINSSRGIIFASNGPDFAEAARRETMKLRDLINQYR